MCTVVQNGMTAKNDYASNEPTQKYKFNVYFPRLNAPLSIFMACIRHHAASVRRWHAGRSESHMSVVNISLLPRRLRKNGTDRSKNEE